MRAYEAFMISRVFRVRVGPTWNPSLAAQSASHEEVPVPENPTELKSFVGLVNYYRKFIPDIMFHFGQPLKSSISARRTLDLDICLPRSFP